MRHGTTEGRGGEGGERVRVSACGVLKFLTVAAVISVELDEEGEIFVVHRL